MARNSWWPCRFMRQADPELRVAGSLPHGPSTRFSGHRYEEFAHVPKEPVASIVSLEPKEIHDFVAVPDKVRQPATLDISKVRQDAALASPSPPFSARSVPLLTLLLIGTSVALVATGIRRRRNRMIVWPRAPKSSNAPNPIEVPNCSVTPATPDTPISVGFSSGHTQDPLAARFAARNAVFRFQPQIDLQTGRVAGVEALLCVPGAHEFRPAIELAAEIEASGHGLALLERRLHEACREQSAWLKRIGHEFPIGVPVSQRTLANAAFLPLVQRILAENELAALLPRTAGGGSGDRRKRGCTALDQQSPRRRHIHSDRWIQRGPLQSSPTVHPADLEAACGSIPASQGP